MLHRLLIGSISPRVVSHSWKGPVLKSKILMSLVFIILPRYTDGTRIGLATGRRWLRSMENAGIGYGCFSLHIAPSPAGMSPLYLSDRHSHRHRQGSASVFQITMHKNLNGYHRIQGVPSHASIHVRLDKDPMYVPHCCRHTITHCCTFRLIE